jgi:Uma2 family endonuclease
MRQSMSTAGTPEALPVIPPSRKGQPAWEIATLFPPQGEWSESEYLALESSRLVELSDGCLEFLPMPVPLHQLIVAFLYESLWAFVKPNNLGKVFFAPLPVRLRPGKYREPDIVFVKADRLKDLHQPPEGADLVMEVLSEGEENRARDLVTKRGEYAAAGIAEYWIVDPQEKSISVLTLEGHSYREHGVFAAGASATSALLPAFALEVDKVFGVA